jgi:hypothetical protein
VHLWVVPAPVEGVWCGVGKARGKRLEISQQFQQFEGRLGPDAGSAFRGRIDGGSLRASPGLAFTYEDRQLHNTHASGRFAGIHGARFRPLRGKACR